MDALYLGFVALHVILSLSLIVIVILQPGKGGDIGAAFGGGGSAMFGPRGPGSAIQGITTGVAVAFMGTSIVLALYSNQALLSGGGDVMDVLEQRALDRRQRATAGDESGEGVGDLTFEVEDEVGE